MPVDAADSYVMGPQRHQIPDDTAARAALAQREELLLRLTETLPIGVVQVNPRGDIIFSNPRWFEIVGLPHSAPFGAFVDLADQHDADDLRQGLRLAQVSGLDQELRVQLTTTSGDHRTCRVRLSALSEGPDGRSVVVSLEDVTESRHLQRQLVEQADRDPLTGLLNRKAIIDRLDDVIRGARCDGSEAAVAFIDLDGFKAVNDRHGHAAGDQVLREVASAIRNRVRTEDLVGRLGGDEFVIVIPRAPSPVFVSDLAKRLEIEISSILVGAGERLITGSIGVAMLGDCASTPAELLAVADRRMYEAKRRRQRAEPAPQLAK